MPTAAAHRGVAAEDPRNAGPIAFFAPKPMTLEAVRERLAPYFAGRAAGELDARVAETLAKIARGPVAPNPPLSQPLEAARDPWMGLGTHPEIIEEMWALDDGLPERCRWLVWGGPALVHPRSGVIFARGYGTIGFAVRLPAAIRDAASPDEATAVVTANPGLRFDIAAAGPEWRFLRHKAPRAAWIRAAYDFAA